MDTQDRKYPVAQAEPISTVGEVSHPLDTFGIIIFFVILLQVGLMIGLNLYQKSRIKTLDADMANKQAELASPTLANLNTQVDEVISGQQKLEIILGSKLKWSSFYNSLGAVTPNNVKLTSMSINSDGTFKADGQTASLTTLAVALAAWRDGTSATPTPFTSISLTNNGFTNAGATRRITFSMTGQINLNKLHVQ